MPGTYGGQERPGGGEGQKKTPSPRTGRGSFIGLGSSSPEVLLQDQKFTRRPNWNTPALVTISTSPLREEA